MNNHILSEKAVITFFIIFLLTLIITFGCFAWFAFIYGLDPSAWTPGAKGGLCFVWVCLEGFMMFVVGMARHVN